ncbi:hypothetical protein OTERR_17200 [Oryzomicrobium terrae]|uniref:Inner membrane protein n=1 Tax=Oryzomicrobium terrae TaxID=1735038 RepID=A0A5C1E8A5_9RHOO|nr:DUF805 domain-containing protein [Oryzomicrobium terrae]QEL65196.1 hypothetical protein OTERR_17200 [Oryzomicrobium terrae]
MTFTDAIKTCFAKYLDFEGRASRSEYWWWLLFLLLASIVANLINENLGSLVSLALLLPSLAVATRRLHDIDRSGWWQLIGLIPVIGTVVMIYWCVQEGKEPNRFGAA